MNFNTNQERYAILVRVSTDKQANEGDSIDMQVNRAMDIIRNNNGIHYKTYIESGVSATKTNIEDRYELIEAFNDARKGLFDVLIVYARDRLYRKVVDKHIIFSWVGESKIDLIFSQTGERFKYDPDDPEQEFMEDIKASINRLESAKTRVRVKTVRADKAKRGEDNGGNLPYGYIRTENKIVPVEDEIPIIKEIEELYLAGYGLHSIARWLNGDEVKKLGIREGGRVNKRKQHARSSEYWTKDVIKTILFNPFYTGYREYSTNGDKRLNKNKAEIKIAKGQHTAMRSEGRHRAIQAMKNKKSRERKAPNFYNTTFLLSGLLFCEECGEKFYSRNSTRANGNRYSYYSCSSKVTQTGKKGCENHAYKKETLEAFVVSELKNYFNNMPFDSLVKDITSELNNKNKQAQIDYNNVEKEIKALDRGKASMIKAIQSLDPADILYDELKNTYEEELRNIITKLADNRVRLVDLKGKIEEQQHDINLKDDIIEKMKNFSRVFESSPAHLKKALLDEIIDKIELSKEGNININLKVKLKQIEQRAELVKLGDKRDFINFGGVGDTTTLIVGPIVAAAGVPVAKMSGRGLGHTGGTIDKLEAFKGFSVDMAIEKFIDNVNKIKIAIGGQTANLAPADKKLYALRDVTATVDSISLIAGSIMSKKIASGADAIVLDVKTGSGAFMKDEDSSFELAKEMVDIGNNVGRNTVAVITDMDQPLGYAVGNALEVKEAIDTLKGEGPKDLTELCLVLGSHMLVLGGKAENAKEARKILKDIIDSGKGLEKLKELVKAQGGAPSFVDEPSLFESAAIVEPVTTSDSGFVKGIKADDIGKAALVLGAGRETKESEIDLAVGIILHKKIGEFVKAGESIATIYANHPEKQKTATKMILEAYEITKEEIKPRKLIKGIVTKDGIERY